MIEVNKNTLASALPALGKLICRTSPMTLFKSIIVLDIDNLMYFPLPRIELPVYEKAA